MGLRIHPVVLVIALILAFGLTVSAQTTEFTYQGSLSDNSQAANGNYDFEFALFDALSAGTQLGSTITINGVAVSDGSFTVKLDFGGEFPGAGRWLEIRVRQSAALTAKKEAIGSFTTLTPRQLVTSAPYSVKSLSATNATQLGGVDASQYVLTTDPRMTDARIPTSGSADYIQNTTTQQVSSDFNISGTGTGNIFNAATQFNIGGNRVLSVAGSNNLFVGVNLPNTGSDNSFFGRSAGSSNLTGVSNSYFGSFAGRSNTAGNDNSFFGKDAGRGNFGTNNSFFGSAAGRTNTTGNDNSFFGKDAGTANTTGVDNSFFGRSAGSANTTGIGNSFFGRDAGAANTTGKENSFFGRDAGTANTTGFSNSFFGSFAGQSNTNGDSNSFFGQHSGLDNTTGRLNTFVGAESGRYVTIGNNNSFFGMEAGLGGPIGGSTGSDNSYFGMRAGRGQGFTCCSGSNNSFFGKDAGIRNTSGNNNTAVGSGSDVALGSDLTFATAIGSEALVTASNTIQLGRDTLDTVRIGKLGAAAPVPLCLNGSMEIASCASSIRYKSNVENFDSGLELIERLRPVSFNWIDGGMLDVGLVAEEVEKIEPLLTTRNQDGEIEGVKYDRIGVVLVNAVKEQQAQIEKQKEIIESQQKQIDALTALVCANNKRAEICKQED